MNPGSVTETNSHEYRIIEKGITDTKSHTFHHLFNSNQSCKNKKTSDFSLWQNKSSVAIVKIITFHRKGENRNRETQKKKVLELNPTQIQAKGGAKNANSVSFFGIFDHIL
jgi:hypothetical protein